MRVTLTVILGVIPRVILRYSGTPTLGCKADSLHLQHRSEHNTGIYRHENFIPYRPWI